MEKPWSSKPKITVRLCMGVHRYHSMGGWDADIVLMVVRFYLAVHTLNSEARVVVLHTASRGFESLRVYAFLAK